MKARGMLTLEQLKGMVAQGEIETVLAGFTDHYGRLMGKRFDAEMFVDEIAKHGGHACDYLLTVDMEMEPVPGYSFANWELGYGDVHMVPDLATLRLASWQEKTAIVLCDLEGVDVAPRSILRHQIDAAKKAGFTGYAATELEHYLFQTSYLPAGSRSITCCREPEPKASTPRRAGTSSTPACRWKRPRANGARDSTSSTCATPRRSRWPIATSSSSNA